MSDNQKWDLEEAVYYGYAGKIKMMSVRFSDAFFRVNIVPVKRNIVAALP